MVQYGRDPLSGRDLSRRRFPEPPPTRGLRGADARNHGVLTIALLGSLPGFVIGAALGLFLHQKGSPVWVGVLCALGFAAAVPLVTLFITGRAGALASKLHAPSGRTTPPKKQYSYAESLVARGDYEAGVTAFELAVAEDPRDAAPYLRIARVYRDHLDRPDDAARWFRRALAESAPPPGIAALARRELVELYVHRMGQPGRAAPELARMAEEMAGTPDGAWAARTLLEVKARLVAGGGRRRLRLSVRRAGSPGVEPPGTRTRRARRADG